MKIVLEKSFREKYECQSNRCVPVLFPTEYQIIHIQRILRAKINEKCRNFFSSFFKKFTDYKYF